MSRSSLSIIKITHVEIVTILQFCNTAFWIYIAIYQNVSIWIQFPLMVFVGLMGGTSYVNVSYLILSTDTIPY